MNIRTIVKRRRLVNTIFLIIAFCVAAMFIGSAVSTGIGRTVTGDDSKDIRSAPIPRFYSASKNVQPLNSIKTTILSEDFEGAFPPTGWTQIITDADYTWKSASYDPHGGTLYTNCEYDPSLIPQDEWLVTPTLDFTGFGSISLSFWWYMSYYWAVDPYDNYDLNVMISTDGGSTWTQLWNEDNIGVFNNWEWYDATFGTPVDLSAYIGQSNVKIGFQYIGTDGAEAALDDILVYGYLAGDHNLGILSIDTPESGNAGIITPSVTIINRGTSDETNVPLNLLIGKRQVNGTVEDFEASNGGYTATGTPSIVWEWGTPTGAGPGAAHSGVNVWGTNLDGNYPDSTNNKLDTPSFAVPQNAELTFWHWYDTEAYYDGGNVKISTNGGTSWTIIYPADGYPEDAASSGNAGIPGEPCFSGHDQNYWKKESFDLTAYGGQTVNLRFHFGSDSSVNYPGWYIDDVAISTISWINEYNQTQTFDIASGTTAQVSMPSWTPVDLYSQENIDIDYNAEANVTLSGDIDPTDNYLAKPFSLHFGYFHDVAVTEIVSPSSGSAEVTTPELILANNGQNSESVSVDMSIDKIEYSDQWTQEQYSGEGIWERWNPEDLVYCQPAYGSGSFMAASSDDHSGWTFDVEIFTNSMDMTGETSVTFSCAENFQDLGGDDTGQIGIYSGGVLQETAYYQYGIDDPTGGGVVSYNFNPSTYPDPSNVQIGFYYSTGVGTWDWGFGIDDVLVVSATVTYIDWDFELQTFPPAAMTFIFEYSNTVNVTINAGESMNVVFPDWTPSDITLSDIDYRVTGTATLIGQTDGHSSDNELVKWITLTYIHDTAMAEITQPTGPEGNWPPGTYSVAGVIENRGSFTEYNVLVNTKIWKLENKADILFYQENVTVPTLAIAGSAAVSFPDVTFENEDEGNFRLEMRTMLPGDDHPNNDKLTKSFVIQAPDITPPVTTAELTGTVGQDNWYISNVTVTLTAIDPEGMAKGEIGNWPTGVNHTYYQIDDGAWNEYSIPFLVTTDSVLHTIHFYSDDKAGNVEAEKTISFKQDKTAPEVDKPVNTKQNLMGTEWLISVNATDATSGIMKVEFYVDDVLAGEVTAVPYELAYQGKIQNRTQALVYDAAGNTKLSPIAYEYNYGEYGSQTTKLMVSKIIS